ncbi:MAG: polysaccharide biosynthesis tyrosine autokinase [Bacteroides sp.]|jgi:capsular exopolysaccharide synthesis family protein|nr:polysaccharide biosynthesis tyrosine autokinase [Bacteroides sp.]
MKENSYDNSPEDKEEKVNYRELFFKYFIYWKWFVISFVVCVAVAWLYLHYATPVYNISASVIIRDEKKGGDANIGSMAMFEDLGLMSASQNIDNEIEIMQSKSLIKNVVTELNLYIRSYSDETFKKAELYKTSPVHVYLSPQDADKLPQEGVELVLELHPDGKLEVSTTINDKEINKTFDKLPAVLPTEAGTFGFMPDSIGLSQEEPIRDIRVMINAPLQIAKNYAKNLTIEPTSKTTSVAAISLKSSNQQRGEDFINKLVEMYNRSTNDDKNEVAQKTEEFIRERIDIINRELGSTEQELESFKRDAGVTDLTTDAQLMTTEKAEYEKKRVANGTQLNLVGYLETYLSNPNHVNDVLPTNVGLEDNSLTELINQYNTMVLERNRLLRSSSESNPVVTRLNSSLRDMRANLSTTISSVRKGLLITKADMDRQEEKYAGRISNAPGQERKLVGIQRQQEIKSGLYLMLLQKREENAMALAATTNNARIIDNAIADEDPVSPKKKLIYLIALVMGIGIPVGSVYLKDLLQFRIEGRQDVERLTKVPIIGDVPLSASVGEQGGAIVVRENDNDIMAETFRNIRTNLLFMLGDTDRKVIMVTSTTSGEGKSFISSNLAVSLSLLGKKVVIIGLDIRKPGLNKVFQISHKEKGITQYLATPHTTDLFSLIQPSDVTENLYLLPGGLIPPNPTELLSGHALEDAINLLREKFDYVVLDTAPIGMVTDTQIIGRVADVSIYVCRADYTNKADYQLINDLYEQKRLPSLCTIINGLDMNKKKYGYYYGYGKYGKYYGYGKKYGYGYGYGNKHNKQNNEKQKINK